MTLVNPKTRRRKKMFTVTPNGPNRVDIELSGKLNSSEMKVALNELLDKTKDIRSGLMLYRITDFALPTVSAMAIEFSRLPSLFGLIRNFDRCAVLADQNWLKTISEIEGALIPGLEIKGFSLSEAAIAEAWLAEDR
jgi:hypothetical protein